MSLLRRFFARPAADPVPLIARFLSAPEHRWILADPALRKRFPEFLSLLPMRDLERLVDEKRLLLLYSNGRLACSLHQFQGREIVLVFPELRRLLGSASYREGFAVLAHEIAHILLEHTKNGTEARRAQLEADAYAVGLCLGEEMFHVLSFEEPTAELVDRLTVLRRG